MKTNIYNIRTLQRDARFLEDLQRKQPAIIVPVFRLSLNPDMTMVQKNAAENT